MFLNIVYDHTLCMDGYMGRQTAHITIHTQCMIIYNIQEHILAHF